MYTVWIINDFDLFCSDPQCLSFSTVTELQFDEAIKLIKMCSDRGIVTILEPITED